MVTEIKIILRIILIQSYSINLRRSLGLHPFSCPSHLYTVYRLWNARFVPTKVTFPHPLRCVVQKLGSVVSANPECLADLQ